MVIIASFLCNIHKKIPDDEFVLRSNSEHHVNDLMNNEDDFTSWKEEFNFSPVKGLNTVPNQR